ncbi:MAG: M48 family metalloprotease [Spirulina sp. SIO3F2]|nr:M48 family metalloprotease [Spirulina sp. SIO3F2]
MTSIPEPSFAKGQAAFAQKDYETAIAHLQPIAETDLDPATRTQAYQTLILAYYRADRVRDAIDLCKRISQDTETYPWAAKTLKDLTRRYRKANAAAFQPPGQQRSTPKAKSEDAKSLQRPLPMRTPEAPEVAASVFVSGREWRNAERAQKWQPMRKPRRWKFWLRIALTMVALFWVMQWGWTITAAVLQWLGFTLPLLTPPRWLDATATRPIIGSMIVCAIASPWLLDAILTYLYKRQSLPLYTLANQHPETAKVLQRLTRQHQIPMPKLGLVNLGAPWIITYGNWPRTARIVMSDALLEQLEDEELAVVVASQFAAIVQYDLIPMSGAIALLQLPFLAYQYLAQSGNWLRTWQKIPSWGGIILQTLCGWLASGFYGIYWLWRLPLLYFARQRIYYGDRFGAEFTGNPNALSRALLKLTMGISQHISQRQETLPLLEAWDLLMPLSHRQAVSLGGLPDKTPFSEMLVWDCTNPYRQWLALVNSHPLLGDRIYLLNRYANYWKLQPELELPTIIPPPKTLKDHAQKFKRSYTALPILQSAVLAGIAFGIVSRLTLWLIGSLAKIFGEWFSLWRLIWLADANPFLNGCIAIAFSLSLIVWINGYFPDIRIAPSRQDPRIEDLLRNARQVPPKSYPVRLEGTLLGRPGALNWLGQDLILHTSSGLMKLHFFSKLGPLGNLLPWPARPVELVGKKVTVFGWFRRGSTPWVDVDVIRATATVKTRSGYPVWVTILAIAAALWGAYSLWQA